MEQVTHEVVRSFHGPDGRLTPGTRVDASNWRLTDKLVEQRYLKPIEKAGAQTGAQESDKPKKGKT